MAPNLSETPAHGRKPANQFSYGLHYTIAPLSRARPRTAIHRIENGGGAVAPGHVRCVLGHPRALSPEVAWHDHCQLSKHLLEILSRCGGLLGRGLVSGEVRLSVLVDQV